MRLINLISTLVFFNKVDKINLISTLFFFNKVDKINLISTLVFFYKVDIISNYFEAGNIYNLLIGKCMGS